MVVIGLLVGLIVCIAPIAVLVLIISAFMKRNKEEKSNFEETIRGIYVYIILIVSLITIISGVITSFRIGLDIVLPEKSQSSYRSEEQDKNENIIELATTISLVVTATPIFIYHNKLAKKSREIKTEENKIGETNN